jgi:hypothetical protein
MFVSFEATYSEILIVSLNVSVDSFIQKYVNKQFFQCAYVCSRKVAGSIPDYATGIFH